MTLGFFWLVGCCLNEADLPGVERVNNDCPLIGGFLSPWFTIIGFV
jgi:hypothetical protein